MPPAGARKLVDAIPGLPLPNGLLSSCATVIDVTDPHELMGVDWQPLTCCGACAWDEWCPDDDSPEESPGESPAEPAEKEFCRPAAETAAPVTIYAGVACSAPGWRYDQAVEHARAALQMGQQAALEAWVQANVLAAKADDRTPAEGAVSMTQAVGILEGWNAASFGGMGVLHVPAGLAAYMCRFNLMHREGRRYRTCLGNCVVLGGGYGTNLGPGGAPAPAGQAWLYITGPVVIRREATQIIPDTDKESFRILNNDRMVLAERTYVVQVECDVHAALVDLCGCCP